MSFSKPPAQATSRRNHLAGETSPYLLQHVHNPVDWHPWGPQALDLARQADKPILLSIGYSACHWCHVMAHESFEDEATAAVMNELFVNIKVDREERPDLDRIYQLAHQLLIQRVGGWPLTMFLSPHDHTPFFGGTYFPNQSHHGVPAFADLLRRVAAFYRTRADDIARQSSAVRDAFAQMQPPPAAAGTALTRQPLATARELLAREFDADFGGFGTAPKFPQPGNLALLLRLWRYSAPSDEPDLHALFMATLTLTRMAEGGICDQLGGGFARYSVDRYWMIPHFEKMLYDNALLLAVYAQAALATGDELFERIAAQTAAWMIRDLRAPNGGFWSALDADSEGHEGKFYAWDAAKVRDLLGASDYEVFSRRFGLDRAANFEGAWHLHAYRSVEDIAGELHLSVAEVTARLSAARMTLLQQRDARVWPGRDEKILTAWNGLAISGLAQAARVLQREDLTTAAAQCLEFVKRELWSNGRLQAVHAAGRARFPAYLDDYAFMLDGVLQLLQNRFDGTHLQFARELAEAMLAHFEDATHGGFFFTADDHETLLHRSKSFADEALPAGNAVAAQALTRLGLLVGETRYLDAAARTLHAAWEAIERYPHAHSSLLIALDEHLEPPEIVVIRGPQTETDQWRTAVARIYAPQRMVLAIAATEQDLPPALAAKVALDTTVAYVCKGMTCSEPVHSLAALLGLMRR